MDKLIDILKGASPIIFILFIAAVIIAGFQLKNKATENKPLSFAQQEAKFFEMAEKAEANNRVVVCEYDFYAVEDVSRNLVVKGQGKPTYEFNEYRNLVHIVERQTLTATGKSISGVYEQLYRDYIPFYPDSQLDTIYRVNRQVNSCRIQDIEPPLEN